MIGLPGLLWLTVIHLIAVGTDVIGFFLLIRVLVVRWPVATFIALDRVGTPVVDPMVRAVARVTHPTVGGHSLRRQQTTAAVLLIAVEIVRLTLTTLASAGIAVRTGL